MSPRKLLFWAAIAFVVFFIATNPDGAAATANGIGTFLGNVATGAANFLTALTGGAR